MKLQPLGRTGLRVSSLGLGTMTFGHPRWGSDEATARRIVARFLAAGGNFLDTADVYGGGRAEEILGRVLRGRRDEVILATKVGGPTGPGRHDIGLSRTHILAAVDASLRRLATDRIDLYQVHAYDPTTPLEETLRALDDCVRAGKVRHLGCSNWSAWQLMKANARAAALDLTRFEALQPQYSLVSRHLEREHLPLCREEGIAVLPWSPLAGGLLASAPGPDGTPPPGTRAAVDADTRARFLSARNLTIAAAVRELARERGKAPAQIALAWVLARPGVTAPIFGARTLEQLDENLGAADLVLDEGTLRRLEEVSALPLVPPYDLHAAIQGLIASRERRR